MVCSPRSSPAGDRRGGWARNQPTLAALNSLGSRPLRTAPGRPAEPIEVAGRGILRQFADWAIAGEELDE